MYDPYYNIDYKNNHRKYYPHTKLVYISETFTYTRKPRDHTISDPTDADAGVLFALQTTSGSMFAPNRRRFFNDFYARRRPSSRQFPLD